MTTETQREEAIKLLQSLTDESTFITCDHYAMQAMYEDGKLIIRSAGVVELTAWDISIPEELEELASSAPLTLVWSPEHGDMIQRIRREVMDYLTPRVEDPDSHGEPCGFVLGEVHEKLIAILGTED